MGLMSGASVVVTTIDEVVVLLDGVLRWVVGGAAQYGSGNVEVVVDDGGELRHSHGQATATTPKPAP